MCFTWMKMHPVNLIQCRVWCHLYLQAIQVQGVEFGFVCSLQDFARLNCPQMLLQVNFNFVEA